MKSVLCYGDSNTWGNIAGSFDQKLLIHQRYPYEDRWTGQLQHLLGHDYQLIEAGLNGRTTGLDDPNKTRSSRNGLTTLTNVLEMNYPIDLVILMLGTNDLKRYFHTTAEEIAERCRHLIQVILDNPFGARGRSPKILLMAPAPIFRPENSIIFDLFFDEGSVQNSQRLAGCYQKLALEMGCDFLDAGAIVKVNPKDGLHITRESQQELAEAVAKRVKEFV